MEKTILKKDCPDCGGTGMINSGRPMECSKYCKKCDGTGDPTYPNRMKERRILSAGMADLHKQAKADFDREIREDFDRE